MADRKIAFGTVTDVTITLASLANASARECTVIDNTTDLFIDAEVYLAILVGTVSGDKVINVWFYGSVDGTNYSDAATGANAALTMRDPTNLRGPFTIACPTNSLTYKVVIGSVAQFFGGVLPPKWGMVIENRTGASLNSTEGNHTKKYRGAYETIL